MAAPKGHPLWGNPLKPKKYTPEQFWEGACEYFQWCEDNPIMVIEQSKMPQRLDASLAKTLKPSQIKGFMKQTIELPHNRAYSIERLCIYLNITRETFDNYSKSEGYETYFDICKRIREIIDSQHFEGGMAGTFNANIVTRKLGLIDKQQSDVNVTLPKIEVKDQETKEAIEKLVK
jgi:hypothetical protein